MNKFFRVFLYLLTSWITSALGSECTAVYQNATKNVTDIRRTQTELSYYFNKYCQRNGELNTQATSIGLDVVVSGIPFSFTGSNQSSSQKLEEFCKIGAGSNFFTSSATDYKEEIIVAALNSFNQCIASESRGLRLSYLEQNPESVLIFGEFTNGFTKASLDAIVYNQNSVACESTGFTSDGKAIKLLGDKSYEITKNFTITCKRKSSGTEALRFYPRTTIGISTSLGPMTIDLTQDRLFGYALASKAKEKIDLLKAQKDLVSKELENQKTATLNLQNRLNSVSVELGTVSNGEYDVPSTQFFQPRLYCPGNEPSADPSLYAKNQCGPNRQMVIKGVGSHGGNKCGYNHYVYACINK